jgi:hypothetical protein
MKRVHPVLWFLIGGLFAGAAFWIVEGRTLAWDIYTNGEYLYSEEFALRGKILVSCSVGLLFAGALFGAWYVFRWIRGKEPIQPPQTTTGSSAPDRV